MRFNGRRFFLYSLAWLFLAPAAWAAGNLPWALGEKEGTFLVMADIHFDPYADPSLISKLASLSVDQWQSLFESSTDKKFATYGKDTNYPLFKSTLDTAAKLDGDCDYVLVNGDYLSHEFKTAFDKNLKGDNKAYQEFVLKTVVFVSRLIQRSFPDKPVYFCLGNNDSDCDDYGGLAPGTPFLSTLAQEWATVAKDPEAVKTFTQGGYYAVPHPTLKGHWFVVLNDVSWSKKYNPSCHTAGDIGKEEMAWLSGVLKDARVHQERVTIITHMPPGIHSRNASEHPDRTTKPQHTFYELGYLWPFLNLLAPYRDLIDAEFAGHTHLDDFRVIQDRSGKPVFFTHIAPAVSPVHHNNPGFQVMLYDKKTGGLEDMATYYLPLASSDPQWKLEYTFREAYGYKSYNFESLKALADAIEIDPTVRGKFVDFAAQESKDNPPIKMDNWKFFGCAHLNLDPDSYRACYR